MPNGSPLSCLRRPQVAAYARFVRPHGAIIVPIPLPKLLLAAFGATAMWRSYRAYRARHRDLSLPPDPVTDGWWKCLATGGAIVGGDLLLLFLLHNTIGLPTWLLYSLFTILAAGVLLVFVASFMIGWRGAGC